MVMLFSVQLCTYVDSNVSESSGDNIKTTRIATNSTSAISSAAMGGTSGASVDRNDGLTQLK